ncbi:TIGR00730 family Rossman fold protein [Halalkalibacter sp. APA_J-10(15)]|uniref:LOG family protein n=1 Tax=unclassified Halalkalibacter TaxID=2893063 RepID=UPI001FF56BD4|nr:TIGR00730 family Rossman fold protein [Halalkalibacter sp. APA_J-10(15)]MCK0470538.1 TIGR00730 family Rossman fold protein [Halalkalibacter sp. APA_J-10(15)]
MRNHLAVFCGSSYGDDKTYIDSAEQFGMELANKGKVLIYGGAQVGCMGAIANKVLEYEGKVIGVIPEKLKNVELAHEGLSELIVVESMHERKAQMAELADGFVALPGGSGTLEEWFEVFTWAQLGYHQKPCGLLNVNGFFDPLMEMIDHIIKKGFMKREYKDLILISSDPAELLHKIDTYKMSYTIKWT